MFIKTLYFFDRKKSFHVLKQKFNGPSPSGKASGFGLDIPRFESQRPSSNIQQVSSKKLFLFDFDGVIVDGMHEYWQSSLLAYEKFLNSTDITVDQKLYKKVPDTFKEIRPWVKYGWEMILIVHEIIKTENPLNNLNKDDFIAKYPQNCQRILKDLRDHVIV